MDLSSTIEKYQEENRRIYSDMKKLMQRKKDNDEKMSKAIVQLRELSGKFDENEMRKYEVAIDSVPPKERPGLTGYISNFLKYVLAGIVTFIIRSTRLNRVVQLYGFMMKPIRNVKTNSFKRKFVDTEAIEEFCSNEAIEEFCSISSKEFDQQRWSPEDETGDEEYKDDEDSTPSLDNWSTDLSNHSHWNHEPIINFVNDKVFGVKTINDSENLIRNLTPKRTKTTIVVEDVDADVLDDFELKTRITPSDSFEELVMDKRLKIEPSESFGDVNHDLTGFSNRTTETSTPVMQDLVPGVFVFSGSKCGEEDSAVVQLGTASS